MRRPDPFEVLYERRRGSPVGLPKTLARICGPVRFPRPGRRPYVVGNFAASVDGVVSLNEPGVSSGGEITGFDPHDRLWMGVLRALADAVVLGAGTQRAAPRHVWTAEHVYPPMAREFGELRRRLGKPATPRNVVVTASGRLDLDLPVFTS
ncbi:MAG TPA: dihydrofolate reductase family protein, partial [Thermoplasmata archaeon]|nr:dihydrofolate reductase family protein [Thermoplasmata archaeon]